MWTTDKCFVEFSPPINRRLSSKIIGHITLGERQINIVLFVVLVKIVIVTQKKVFYAIFIKLVTWGRLISFIYIFMTRI